MMPLMIRIGIAASDAFIYAGRLFIVLKDRRIGHVALSSILHKAFREDGQWEKKILRIAFSRNDYYSNTQGETIFGIDGLPEAFRSAWDAQAMNPLEIDWDDADFTCIAQLPNDSTVLDIRAYAMRLFFATSNSVHEIRLNPDDNGYDIRPGKLERIFDGVGMSLSAKGGEVLVSTGHDGLMNGTIRDDRKHTIVNEHPIQDVSFRSGWSGFNLLNYVDQSRFNYLINDTIRSQRKIERSKFDERPSKQIAKFGSKVLSGQSMDRGGSFSKRSVIYAFNSASSAFMYDTSGQLTISSIIKDAHNEAHLSSRPKTIDLGKRSRIDRPVSHAVIPGGCIIEFFDRVQLCQNNEVTVLQEGAMLSTKSYMSSARYKNLLTTVGDDFVTIFSIYPLDFKSQSRRPIPQDEE